MRQTIDSRFGAPARPAGPTPAAGKDNSFAAALSAATQTPATSNEPRSSLATTRTQFARDVLSKLGIDATSENIRAMNAWAQAEGTRAQFNPLATTQGAAGATRFNSVGVRNYASYTDGVDATVKTMTNGRYGNILEALRAGNSAEAVGRAIADSPWGTHEGVLRVLRSTAT